MPIKCNCDACAELAYRRSQHWLKVGIGFCFGLVLLFVCGAIWLSGSR
jgi:hypothetical protein